MVSTGPVSLRKQTLRYDHTDPFFAHDADGLRARVEGLLGELPPPDPKPAPGEPRTKTIPGDSFMQALRRGVSTLLNVERTGSAKAKFEKTANGLTGVKICSNAVFVFLPSSSNEYHTFTWDPLFSGGHASHPPSTYPTEVEARAAAHAWAQSQSQSQSETLYNLQTRFRRARRRGEKSIRVAQELRNIRIFWDTHSIKRGEAYVDVYDQQIKPGWHLKYAFHGVPEVPAIGAGPTTASLATPADVTIAGILRTFDVGDIAEYTEEKHADLEDDSLKRWRFERHVSGIDFEDEAAAPVHPFVIGYLLSDPELKHIKQADFLNYVHCTLAPLVISRRNPKLFGLDRDPIQDWFQDSRPKDTDENGNIVQFACLRKLIDIKKDEGTVSDELRRSAEKLDREEKLVTKAEVLETYDLDDGELFSQLARLDVVGGNANGRLPPLFLRTSRSDRLQALAGFAEACHVTIGGNRLRLHRTPGWSDGLASDIHSLALSVGLSARHVRYGRQGYYNPADDLSFIEISGKVDAVPCRLTKLVDVAHTRPRNFIQIQSVVHDEWDSDEEFTSFRVCGDGVFLREDYLILGGTDVGIWSIESEE